MRCSREHIVQTPSTQQARTTRENVELLRRDVVECGDISLEVLREHFLRDVCKPIRELADGSYVSTCPRIYK